MSRKEEFRKLRLLALSVAGSSAHYEALCDEDVDEAIAKGTNACAYAAWLDMGKILMKHQEELAHIEFVDGKPERIQ